MYYLTSQCRLSLMSMLITTCWPFFFWTLQISDDLITALLHTFDHGRKSTLLHRTTLITHLSKTNKLRNILVPPSSNQQERFYSHGCLTSTQFCLQRLTANDEGVRVGVGCVRGVGKEGGLQHLQILLKLTPPLSPKFSAETFILTRNLASLNDRR